MQDVTDCGDNSCMYAPRPRRGMRTNGGCQCDQCPTCPAHVRPNSPRAHHRPWCQSQGWVPEHHRQTFGVIKMLLRDADGREGLSESYRFEGLFESMMGIAVQFGAVAVECAPQNWEDWRRP